MKVTIFYMEESMDNLFKVKARIKNSPILIIYESFDNPPPFIQIKNSTGHLISKPFSSAASVFLGFLPLLLNNA